MKALNLFVAVDAVYPLALAVTFLGSSIVVKVRDGRAAKRQNNAISRSRCNWIFRFQFLLSVNILAAIVLALRSSSGGHATHAWDSTSHSASSIAVFLFFAAGLLPGPDTPYQPSLSNAHTWLMALGFETGMAIAYSVCRPPQVTKNGVEDERSLRIAILVLAYLRVLFLCGASALFFSPSQTTIDPESAGLLAGDTEEGTYGTVESGPKDSTPPEDAQSTNWLDYLVGFGQLMPLIWPTDSISLQIRACICVVILILQRVVNVLVPFQLGEVVTALGTGQIPYKELSIYIACRAVQGQQGVLASIRALLWIPIGQATYRRLTQSAFEHVMSLSLQFHLGKKLGEVTSALSKGSALNTFIDSLIFQLFPMVADIGVAAAYFLVKFDPFYSLIILTVGGTYLFITIYMAKYRGRARRDMVTRDREMDAIKTDAIMSYEVVHYNGALQAEKSRFANRMEGFQKSEMSVLVSLNLLNAAQNMIFTLGVVMVSFLSAWRISIGAEAVAMFVSLLAYLAQLQAPLGFFGSFYTQIQNNLIDAERMLSLFEETPSVIDKPGARAITDCKGHITFDRVSFAYDPRRQALHDLSLDIRPGTSVAIVGESGSGKSTLLRLLFRFYDVTAGQIMLDGINVEDITIQSLRNHFGVVPQDTILFNDTLMYNLLYAKPDATEEEIFAVCRAASVHDKILALPDGYNTQVGERGLRLSGGEKQRISIARTILKSPTIILMDEATASLDSETERAIQSSLAEISAGRTTITIAHRLSTIVDCDQIVVLHDGRVVEQGTHSQLLIRNGRYRKMWEKQTKDSGSDKGQISCS